MTIATPACARRRRRGRCRRVRSRRRRRAGSPRRTPGKTGASAAPMEGFIGADDTATTLHVVLPALSRTRKRPLPENRHEIRPRARPGRLPAVAFGIGWDSNAATFTTNWTADLPDLRPGNGFCNVFCRPARDPDARCRDHRGERAGRCGRDRASNGISGRQRVHARHRRRRRGRGAYRGPRHHRRPADPPRRARGRSSTANAQIIIVILKKLKDSEDSSF